MMASDKNGTFYNGITNNLIRRVVEHKEKRSKGFTKRSGFSITIKSFIIGFPPGASGNDRMGARGKEKVEQQTNNIP